MNVFEQQWIILNNYNKLNNGTPCIGQFGHEWLATQSGQNSIHAEGLSWVTDLHCFSITWHCVMINPFTPSNDISHFYHYAQDGVQQWFLNLRSNDISETQIWISSRTFHLGATSWLWWWRLPVGLPVMTGFHSSNTKTADNILTNS